MHFVPGLFMHVCSFRFSPFTSSPTTFWQDNEVPFAFRSADASQATCLSNRLRWYLWHDLYSEVSCLKLVQLQLRFSRRSLARPAHHCSTVAWFSTKRGYVTCCGIGAKVTKLKDLKCRRLGRWPVRKERPSEQGSPAQHLVVYFAKCSCHSIKLILCFRVFVS